MDNIIDDICETFQKELSSVVEKLIITRYRDDIVRRVIQSLPDYKLLVEENTRLMSLQDNVRITITEKSVAAPQECGILLKSSLNKWRDNLEAFIDNMNQNDTNIVSFNQLKEDFDTEFSLYFNDNKIVTNTIELSDDSSLEDDICIDNDSNEPASLLVSTINEI